MTTGSWRKAARLAIALAVLGPVLAACGGVKGVGPTVKRAAFTSKEYGVAVSPRVTTNPNPPKGGGRYLVGKPYTVRGTVYTPQTDPMGYMAQGTASWYGADFHGRRTANGEIFSANAITGAHPTLPLPSYVRVTNLENGRSVLVRVNDRGPYVHGRVMDLSWRAAEILGYVNRGTGNIEVQYVGPAPLEGDDTRMLLASVNRPSPLETGTTRLAMIEGTGPTPAARSTAALIGGGQAPSQGSYSSDDLARDFFGLFGYAEADPVTSAHAAANAMASRDSGLDAWVDAVDEGALKISLQLGVFRDPAAVERIALAFAPLAAVTEEAVEVGGQAATRIVLTRLKPGVARADVVVRAQELGLTDLVLY